MILAVAAGFGLRFAFDLPQAPLIGLLIGVLVAPLIPAKSSCGVRLKAPSE